LLQSGEHLSLAASRMHVGELGLRRVWLALLLVSLLLTVRVPPVSSPCYIWEKH
jgi:hypothetical protein